MPTEVFASARSLLAALDVPASSSSRAEAMTASTLSITGGSIASPATSVPSWADQLSADAAALRAAAACLTLGTALLRPLRTRHVEEALSKLEKTLLTPALGTGLQQLRATALPRPALTSAARTAATSSPAGNTGGEAR